VALTDRSPNGLLLLYRAVAYVVGCGLIILVFAGVPLNWGAHPVFPELAAVVGVLHGFLFIGYLLIVLTIGVRYRMKPHWLVLAGAAGTVPFCSFIAEHYVSEWVRARAAAEQAAAQPARVVPTG
jgi:integral membrane protein